MAAGPLAAAPSAAPSDQQGRAEGAAGRRLERGSQSVTERVSERLSERTSQVSLRRSSLDSGINQMASFATNSSLVTSRLSLSLWPSRSVSVFGLQKEVAAAHAERFGQDAQEDQHFSFFFRSSDLSWCAPGSAFRWLGLGLKAAGVACLAPAFATPGRGRAAARARHLLALVYLAAWQLGLWLALGLHVARAAGELPAPARYGASVKGLLLLAAAAAQAASLRFFASATFQDLAGHATRSVYVRSWAAASWRAALALLALLVALGGAAGLVEGASWEAAVSAVMWLPLLVQHHTFCAVLNFCSLGLDAFALDLLNTSLLEGLVARFDKLHAAMRRSAYAVQAGLSVFVAALSAVLFATLYHLVFASLDAPAGPAAGASAGSAPWASLGNVMAVVWITVLVLLGLHVLNQIARVNAKCSRLPALIQSLDFGADIDHDKWCVVAHIASLEAGFFIYNVPVTRWSVLKFGYFSLAATSFLLTRLVFAA